MKGHQVKAWKLTVLKKYDDWVRRSCRQKKGFSQQDALRMGRVVKQRAYECKWCGQWHLTKQVWKEATRERE